jgi:hypothetical protein
MVGDCSRCGGGTQFNYARCEEVHEVAQILAGKGTDVSASASC